MIAETPTQDTNGQDSQIPGFPVVGIGASAGGLAAFTTLIQHITEDSGMAYVLVQHLDPKHESLLATILQKSTRIPVLEILDHVTIEANHIYVIPSNQMVTVSGGKLRLSTRPSHQGKQQHLPIDLFFISLAEEYRSLAIGIVLSGNASDGTLGLKAIKENGGITFAQDEASATSHEMPQHAVRAGVVDFVLPPEQLPLKILEVGSALSDLEAAAWEVPLEEEEVFRQINSVLRIRKGTDFTHYKQTTIRRRILRRMAINKNSLPAEYLQYLRQHKQEQDVLYQDLLIQVSSFFRDAKIFNNLVKTVFPQIVESKAAGESIRVWVAGCSTGEEAYSLAICFREFLSQSPETNSDKRVQIFATDLSEPAIAKARLATYSPLELAGVSLQRQQEFFVKTNGNFQLIRQVRDMCVFANHNFLKDPPFGKMDLVSCRNVLIYLEPYLQKKALTTFHYALSPKKFLLLGKSETSKLVPELFAPLTKHDKLFIRKEAPGKFMQKMGSRTERNTSPRFYHPKKELMRSDYQKTADEIMLNRYTPAGVVINENMEIVQFRGSTSNYLEQVSGKPTHNLFSMAKPGLAFELRNLIHKVKKGNEPMTKDDIPIQIHDALHTISLEAIPLPKTLDPHFLILFHDSKPSKKLLLADEQESEESELKTDGKMMRILQLEEELAQTRDDMRSITEDQEAANEELQSANEELLSGSEELQSLNEELETSKEELQSTNEELTVLNHETLALNDQIEIGKNYAESIVQTIRESLLVLDKNLHVVTANRAFYQTFRTQESETEGTLLFELGNQQWDIPALHTLLESTLPEKSVFHDLEITQHFPKVGELVLHLNARQIITKNDTDKLILLSIENITERKQKEKEIKVMMERFRNLVMQAPMAIMIVSGEEYVVEIANDEYLQMIERDQEFIGKPVFESLPELQSQGIRELFDRTFKSEIPFHGIELELYLQRKKQKEPGFFNFVYQPLRESDGSVSGIMVVANEVTNQVLARKEVNRQQLLHTKELEEKIQQRTTEIQDANAELLQKNGKLLQMNKELEAFTYLSSHDLQEPLRKIQTFGSRILETEKEKLSEKGQTYFQMMQNSASRMQTLIEDLLLFSRSTTSERKFELTELGPLIAEVTTSFQETIDAKQAIIEASELCPVNIIVFQFRQLLLNLVGNALKFSKPDTPPHIIIRSRVITSSETPLADLPAGSASYEHISVTDNGIGFEKRFEGKIFEAFQRLHERNKYPGSGIGLAIVKKIIDNHNGFIFSSSELDKGTTFDIYLPIS